MAPRKGFEPSTYRLTAECSTVELSRNNIWTWRRPTFPQGLPCSIIGALKLNLRVRKGNGCYLQAIITRCCSTEIFDFVLEQYFAALAVEVSFKNRYKLRIASSCWLIAVLIQLAKLCSSLRHIPSTTCFYQFFTSLKDKFFQNCTKHFN